MDQKLSVVGEVTRYFPYRTARLMNWACCVKLSTDDLAYLRRKLAKSKIQLDNHIVFSTEKCNYWVSDSKLYIGGDLVIGNY